MFWVRLYQKWLSKNEFIGFITNKDIENINIKYLIHVA